MTRYQEITALVEELYASDNALANRAAWVLESLNNDLVSAERELEEQRDINTWRNIHND